MWEASSRSRSSMREVLERRVGDPLDLLDRVGDRLGLRARRLLAHPLGALDLGVPALGDVHDLPDAAARRCRPRRARATR